MMDETKAEFTKSGHRKRASYSTVCSWVMEAWKEVSSDVIKNGFIKAGIIDGDSSTLSKDITELTLHESDDDSDSELQPSNLEPLHVDDDDDEMMGDEFNGFDDV